MNLNSEELGVEEGLENEMDVQNTLIELESRRVIISEAFERWKEARLHLIEVCSQFSNISYKLEELGKESAVIDAQNNYYTYVYVKILIVNCDQARGYMGFAPPPRLLKNLIYFMVPSNFFSISILSS